MRPYDAAERMAPDKAPSAVNLKGRTGSPGEGSESRCIQGAGRRPLPLQAPPAGVQAFTG